MSNDHVPHPVDVHVGLAIRARRKLLRISQEKLAESCGITFQQIQKYERAANRVSASMLVQIAAALSCSSASLLPDGERQTSAEAEELGLALVGAPYGVEFARAYIALPAAHQTALVGVLRVLQTTPAAPAQLIPFDAGIARRELARVN